MNSEAQTEHILAQAQIGQADLEHAVQLFEQAVARVERGLEEVEQLASNKLVQDESCLQLPGRALQESQEAAELVRKADSILGQVLAEAESLSRNETPANDEAPLPAGTFICDGRYRLVRLLHKRPRIHLYLARHLHNVPETATPEQSLVAIREIILAGLAPEVRQQVVRAAFEEFAAPRLFGSPYLPGVGDHLYVEEGRHYLIMQPRPARGHHPSFALPLAELLPTHTQQPLWPDISTALSLSIRLCQTVARLHRMQTVLGELTPEMVLVSRDGNMDWPPLLLAAWPPPPAFWPAQTSQERQQLALRTFPPVDMTHSTMVPGESSERSFAAPEIFAGTCDERSDVYALGALLYLLFTGQAPTTVKNEQLQAERTRGERPAGRRGRKAGTRHVQPDTQVPSSPLSPLPPRFLNERISPLLEQILLRALAPDPRQRFASPLELAEALESLYFKADIPVTPAPLPQAKVSRLKKLLEWLKK